MAGLRLGKNEYRYDPRTLRLTSEYLAPSDWMVPIEYDLDAKRAKLPLGLWGNDEYGDCVLVGKANHLVRLERLDTRRTPKVTTPMVVDYYKKLTGCVTAGDANDSGLIVLDSLHDWRDGWELAAYKNQKTFPIDAYGELDKIDRQQLRAACYLLGGIQFGLSLPVTAAHQINQGQQWEDIGTDEPAAQPGSWGGHLVYAKRYDAGGFYCITWGREHYMTNRFIERYADEVWAVVDKIESHRKYVDELRLRQYLDNLHTRNIG